jgi:hypothetical protein
VEGDDDRLISSEELDHDIQRQASLERLGWRFIRVRASAFYNDPDRAVQPVLDALQRLGIKPRRAESSSSTPLTPLNTTHAQILRRAEEIRRHWSQRSQHKASAIKPSPSPSPVADSESLSEALIVEPGDWVEFILVDAPAQPQLVNIIFGDTDLDKSAINTGEPLAQALLGRTLHEIGTLALPHLTQDLKILQIHKPRKK